MGIETDLASISSHLGRIAAALEALLAEHGFVPTSATTVEKPAASRLLKKTSKKKGSKKKGKVTVGKTKKDDDDEIEWTLPLIRAELHKLQEQENQAAVKSALKTFGGSTLKQIDESKYADLAAHVQGLLDV
jgi:hypothetical protein